MIKIFDDMIPEPIQENIKNSLLGDDFPWYLTNDVTSNDSVKGYKKRPAFFHHLRWKPDSLYLDSNWFGIAEDIAKLVSFTGEVEYQEIIQARAFLQLPLNDSILDGKLLDPCHVDTNEPHTVILYYADNFSGDTLIYDKKWKMGQERTISPDGLTLLKRVTPKKGRIVIFDGRYFHTAEQSTIDKRCVVNINVK